MKSQPKTANQVNDSLLYMYSFMCTYIQVVLYQCLCCCFCFFVCLFQEGAPDRSVKHSRRVQVEQEAVKALDPWKLIDPHQPCAKTEHKPMKKGTLCNNRPPSTSQEVLHTYVVSLVMTEIKTSS